MREKYFSMTNPFHVIRRMGFLLIMTLMLCGLTVSASNPNKINDNADILSDSEEEKLQEQFSAIAEKYSCDVALLTTDTCNGEDFQTYTKRFYYDNGYGYGDDLNGIILMITMGERKFQLTTTGEAEDIFTNYGLDVIDEKITPDLSDGDYYDAFKRYGNLVETFIKEAENGEPFDNGHQFKEPMPTSKRLLFSLIAGIVIAGIVIGSLLGQLKSVGIEKKAQQYVRQGSFNVTRSRDVFLYRTISRRKIEKKESSSSSSGSSSGGHTGSF